MTAIESKAAEETAVETVVEAVEKIVEETAVETVGYKQRRQMGRTQQR